jgi:phosphoglycolate phosphatase
MPANDGGSTAVLFDLDGTLVDSFPGIASAYHHMLQAVDLKDIPDSEIRPLVGQNIKAVLSEHFGLSGNRLEKGVSAFRSEYGSHGLFRYSKYDGIDHALKQLQNDTVTLCIATGKLRSMASDLLAHAAWSETFAVVGGAEVDGSRLHKRDIIAWTLEQLPNGTRAVAMVGDRGVDIEGGRELGLPGIGVTWGYGDTNELGAAGASVIVDSPEQLLRALRDI